MIIENILANFNIIELMIGTALAISFNDIIKYVVDSVIFPVIGMILSIDNLENVTIVLKNQKIQIGLLMSAILKFSIIILVLYLLYKIFFTDLINKIIKIRRKSDQQIINQLKLLNEIEKKENEDRLGIKPHNYF